MAKGPKYWLVARRFLGAVLLAIANAGSLNACQSGPPGVQPAGDEPVLPAETIVAQTGEPALLSPGVPISIRVSAERPLSTQAIEPPANTYTAIRSSRIRLYKCPSVATVSSLNPAATCTLVTQQTFSHPSGFSADVWTFNLNGLKANSLYTASVEFFSGSGAAMIARHYTIGEDYILGDTAWPASMDKNEPAGREYIATDGAGNITMPIDYGPGDYAGLGLSRLDYLVRLKDATAGGNVTGNTVTITNGNTIAGTEDIQAE